MKWGIVIPFGLMLSACGAAASPTLNSGYSHWWPAGLGYPPVTTQAFNAACSVTVYGPTLPQKASEVLNRSVLGVSWEQRYGGETACAASVRLKSLLIAEEVLGPDGGWWWIVGSAFTINSGKHERLRAMRARPALIGHLYRAVAHAVLELPNQPSRCSSNSTCGRTVLITAVSQPVLAQYP